MRRPALLQPAVPDDAGRGGPRRRRPTPAYVELATDADAGLGQDAGAVHLDARASSSTGWPGPSTARPSGWSRTGVADPATIDAVLREAGGFPMGPLELTDLIGQDVNLAVGTSVWEQTVRDARYAPTVYQHRLVEAGHLGRKTRSRGLHVRRRPAAPRGSCPTRTWPGGSSAGPVVTNPVARTLAMLVNEAVDLVARGEASAEDVDTAMRLGTGYPRGPLEWGARDRAATSSPRSWPSSTRPSRAAATARARPWPPAGTRDRPTSCPGRRRRHRRPTATWPRARRMWADDRASRRPRHGAGARSTSTGRACGCRCARTWSTGTRSPTAASSSPWPTRRSRSPATRHGRLTVAAGRRHHLRRRRPARRRAGRRGHRAHGVRAQRPHRRDGDARVRRAVIAEFRGRSRSLVSHTRCDASRMRRSRTSTSDPTCTTRPSAGRSTSCGRTSWSGCSGRCRHGVRPRPALPESVRRTRASTPTTCRSLDDLRHVAVHHQGRPAGQLPVRDVRGAARAGRRGCTRRRGTTGRPTVVGYTAARTCATWAVADGALDPGRRRPTG